MAWAVQSCLRKRSRRFSCSGQSLVRAAAEKKSEPARSYADAFCIATAQRLNATVLTGDPEFKSVEHLIKIRWLTK
jgi:predicted nucleic acid-binding protein